MSILFSPVGTADPFTLLGDGPMIHIVRIRKPEKVVLFLSPKMASCQRADQRYTKAIEMMAGRLGFPVPCVELVESEFEKVHKFDHFIGEFEPILQALASEGKGRLLVNASSGTPGMSQALVAIGSFGRIDMDLLQVSTPKQSNNTGQDREDPDQYDFDELWKLNKESESGKDRIEVVETPNFSDRLIRENVADLVEAYDYEAAYALSHKSRLITDEARRFIKAASDRLNLDGELPASVFAKSSVRYRPNDLLAEYLSVMEVRLAQEHWGEFLRSLTPALTESMKRVLAQYLPEQKYMSYEGGKPTGKYNVEAINNDERLAMALNSEHCKYIGNAAFSKLVKEYCEDEEAREKIGALREAEKKCRNGQAHSIKKSSKDLLERECGISLEQIMDYLFDLHGSAKRGLYRDINKLILQKLDAG